MAILVFGYFSTVREKAHQPTAMHGHADQMHVNRLVLSSYKVINISHYQVQARWSAQRQGRNLLKKENNSKPRRIDHKFWSRYTASQSAAFSHDVIHGFVEWATRDVGPLRQGGKTQTASSGSL